MIPILFNWVTIFTDDEEKTFLLLDSRHWRCRAKMTLGCLDVVAIVTAVVVVADLTAAFVVVAIAAPAVVVVDSGL